MRPRDDDSHDLKDFEGAPPYRCADGHAPIGYWHEDGELCPVCALKNDLERATENHTADLSGRDDVARSQKKILSVADESGVPHDIMGDDFAAACLKDVFDKLNRYEAAAMKGKGN